MPGNIPWNGPKPKGRFISLSLGRFTSCTVVMLTTAGRSLATSVAMSGVPGNTGTDAKGGGEVGAGPEPPSPAACAIPCWQPANEPRRTTRPRPRRAVRFIMSPFEPGNRDDPRVLPYFRM